MTQTLGVHHVASLRGALQPAHGARGSARLRRQAGDSHLAAEHRNVAPYQRRQEAQGLSFRVISLPVVHFNGSLHVASPHSV